MKKYMPNNTSTGSKGVDVRKQHEGSDGHFRQGQNSGGSRNLERGVLFAHKVGVFQKLINIYFYIIISVLTAD